VAVDPSRWLLDDQLIRSAVTNVCIRNQVFGFWKPFGYDVEKPEEENV